MAEVKTVLHMRFDTDWTSSGVTTLRLADPREDLTGEEIQNAMQVLVDNQLYGSRFSSIRDAKVVETITEQFDVVEID